MNRRQAKQQAHAIAENVLATALADGCVFRTVACGSTECEGDCPACRFSDLVEEALETLVAQHGRYARDFRHHDGS